MLAVDYLLVFWGKLGLGPWDSDGDEMNPGAHDSKLKYMNKNISLFLLYVSSDVDDPISEERHYRWRPPDLPRIRSRDNCRGAQAQEGLRSSYLLIPSLQLCYIPPH